MQNFKRVLLKTTLFKSTRSITLLIFNRFTCNFDRIFKTKLSKDV